MVSNNVATCIGFSSILTVFSAINIAILYELSKFNITGLRAFGIIYIIWIIIIAIFTLTGGDE